MARGSSAQAAPKEKTEKRNLPAKVDPKVTIELVQKGLEDRQATLAAYLEKQNISPERFRKTVVQAISQNRKLALSTPTSLIFATLDAAQLGLEPTGILGGAWIVPYWSSKLGAYEAKLIVGYRGYIDLLRRSGEVETIEARVVYKGDEFDVSYGTEQRIRHVPYFLRDEESGERVGAYWIARLRGGGIQFDVLPISDIEKARKSSRAADGGPWTEWYDPMAQKTAIRRAVSTLPISVFEARRAVQLENEAEEHADPEVRVEGGAPKKTARDRAVALLAGSDGSSEAEAELSVEDGAGNDEAGSEQAPGSGTPDTSSATDEADSGRPTGSEPGEALSGTVMDDDEDLPDIPETGKKDDPGDDLGL
jgi:recombination protein RecT